MPALAKPKREKKNKGGRNYVKKPDSEKGSPFRRTFGDGIERTGENWLKPGFVRIQNTVGGNKKLPRRCKWCGAEHDDPKKYEPVFERDTDGKTVLICCDCLYLYDEAEDLRREQETQEAMPPKRGKEKRVAV